MALTPYEVATPYEGHTLAAEQIANTVIKEEEAKIAAAPKEHLSGQTTEMIAPDGKLFNFPVENLAAAQKAGFRIEEPEETSARKYIEEHPVAAAYSSFARGLLNGPTLGIIGDKQLEWINENISKPLGIGISESQMKTMSKVWEKKHGAVLAGDIAGMILTLPVAEGVAGFGGKLAFGSEAMIAKGGATAFAGSAYRGAMEGMALSAGKAIRETVDGNPKLAAETMAWGLVPGAVIGGASELLPQLAKGVAAPASKEAGEFESSTASRAWFRSVGGASGKKALMDASTNIPGGHEAVAKFVNEVDPVLRRGLTEAHVDYEKRFNDWAMPLMFKRLPRNAEEASALSRELQSELRVDEETANGLVNAKMKFGETPEAFYEVMDTALTEALKDPKRLNEVLAARREKGPLVKGERAPQDNVHIDGFDTQRFVTRVHKELTEQKGSPFLAPFFESIENGELKRVLQAGIDTREIGPHLGVGEFTGEVVPFAQAWKWRQHLDDLVYRTTRAQGERVEELRKVRGIFQDELERQGSEVANALGKYDERFARALPELKQANETYAKLAAWRDGVAAEAAAESRQRTLSLSDNSWAVGGAIMGAISGTPMPLLWGLAGAGAHRFLRRNWHSMVGRMASGMPSLELSLASMGKELMALPQALDGELKGAIPAHKILPSEVLSQWVPKVAEPAAAAADTFADADVKKGDPVKAYLSFASEISRLATNPAALQARIKPIVDALMQESPAVAMATAQHYAAMIAHINQVMPKPMRPKTALSEKVTPYVSKSELNEFAQRLAIIDNPMVAMQFMATRSLTRAHLETLFKVWPQTYNMMVTAIQARAADPKARPLDWRGNVQASLLLGVATVPQMTGKSIAGIQQVYVAEQMGAAPKGGKPTNVKGPDVLTEAQRLTSGRKR